MTSRGRAGFGAAAFFAALSIVGCAGTSTGPAEPGRLPTPTRRFASDAEAEAALLQAEDRRAWDEGLLASAAQSPEAAVRARAALAIGRIGDERGGAILVRLFSDRSPDVRSAAAFGSQILGDPSLTADLIPLLSDPDGEVVQSAAEAIGFLGRGDGQDALVAAIPGAASPEPRATMLEALWRFANPAAEAAAVRYAADPDPIVRGAAIYTLSRKPLEASRDALTAALRDSEADTAAAAARGLGVLAQKESLAPLAAALDSGKAPLVTNALVALEAVFEKNPGSTLPANRIARVLALGGDANPNIAIPALTLLRQFESSDRDVRRRLWSIAVTGEGRRRQVALFSVVAAMRGRAGQAIEAAIRSSDPRLRAAAGESLLYLSPEDARPYRARLAADADPIVRTATLTSLQTAEAARGSRALVDAALSDPDPGVRAAAIEALTLLGDPGVLASVAQALSRSHSDSSPDLPIAAIAAAEKFRSDPAARPIVEAAYRHPRTVVQRLAHRSLVRSFRADPKTFPRTAYETGKTAAEYSSLLSEAKKAQTARIETPRGSFTVRLAGTAAPLTVTNFVNLARRNYFDGVAIHRVVPNFVIQDGDPTGTGNGGPGYEIRDELNPLEYREGTVGMALSGPDTGGSQWFVTLAPQPHLDGIYTVFGQVVSGQDVVERIEQGDRITRVVISEGS